MMEGIAASGLLFAALWLLFKLNRVSDHVERNYSSIDKKEDLS